MLDGIVKRLRSALSGADAVAPSAPAGMRLYAVGDIHGRDDLLAELLARIVRDGAQAPGLRKIIIYLGDYVDRGLQSRQVLDRLAAGPPPGFEAVYLKGNHEAAMLQFLADPAFGKTWKYYGGLETLHSYGITELTLSDDPAIFEQARAHFEAVLPVRHRDFLQRLQLSAEFGDYFFAHAGVRPGIALSRQIEEDLLWIRDEFLDWRGDFGRVVVHGHTPREAPVLRANRIGIDTGAYMTNVLTCLVVEDASRRILQTGEIIAPDVAAQ